MPAAPPGTVIMTPVDGLTITFHYDPATGAFLNPAIDVTNSTGRAQTVVANRTDTGAEVDRWDVPTGTFTVSRAQIRRNGITSWTDLGGIGFTTEQ